MRYDRDVQPRPKRILVDPAAREARATFERVLAWIEQLTDAEYLDFGVRAGLMNPDGTPKPPEGDPCVTRVD